MAACLGNSNFKDLENETGGEKPAAENKKREFFRFYVTLENIVITCLLVVALIAIAGLILGAWATNESKEVDSQLNTALNGGVLLANNPKASFPGYQYAGSMFEGTGYWSKNDKSMPHYRSDHGALAYGPYIYLIGGLTDDAGIPRVLNSIVRYDTYTNMFDEMASLQTARYRFGYAMVGSDIYIFGGFTGFDDGVNVSTNTMEVFSIANNETTTLPGLLNVPRSDLCADQVNGLIYAFGGYSAGYTDPWYLGISEVYDPATGVWTMTPMHLNNSRGDCRVASMNGTLFVVGGYGGPNDTYNTFLNSVEMCDPVTNKCTAAADMRYPRGDFALTILPNQRIFVAGGETGVGDTHQIAIRMVEEYIMEDDVWIIKAPLPNPAFRFDCANVLEVVYSFGGEPTCNSSAANPNDTCIGLGLNDIFVFQDIPLPRVYFYIQGQGLPAVQMPGTDNPA